MSQPPSVPSATPPPEQPRRGGLTAVITVIIVVVLGYLGIDVSGLLDQGVTPTPAVTIVLQPIVGTPSAVAVAATPTARPINTPRPTAVATPTVPDVWYEVFFSAATCPPEAEQTGGPDTLVAADIVLAQERVDIASFDLESLAIIDALIAARANGVDVRVVVDDEHTPVATINRLRRNRISVIEDRRAALMHNKFVVIDGHIVWTGSMNFAPRDVYCHDNNLVRFDAPALAANYSAELDEMYIDRAFGPTSPRNTTDRLTINGVSIENYFASEFSVAPAIARVVARADEEVLFMAFSFTNEDIGEAVIERAEAGLPVRGVIETLGSNAAGSYLNDFRRARLDNLQVLRDGNSSLLHHKVFIIDRRVTVLGSFNFSGSANDSNDENVVIVYDPIFASFFIEEFERVWAVADGAATP